MRDTANDESAELNRRRGPRNRQDHADILLIAFIADALYRIAGEDRKSPFQIGGGNVTPGGVIVRFL